VDEESTPSNQYPVSKRPKHFSEFFVDPITHLSYAFTWFSLAIVGLVVMFHLSKRNKKILSMMARRRKKIKEQ